MSIKTTTLACAFAVVTGLAVSPAFAGVVPAQSDNRVPNTVGTPYDPARHLAGDPACGKLELGTYAFDACMKAVHPQSAQSVN